MVKEKLYGPDDECWAILDHQRCGFFLRLYQKPLPVLQKGFPTQVITTNAFLSQKELREIRL